MRRTNAATRIEHAQHNELCTRLLGKQRSKEQRDQSLRLGMHFYQIQFRAVDQAHKFALISFATNQPSVVIEFE